MFSCVGGFINLILHCRTTASADTATLGGFFFFPQAVLCLTCKSTLLPGLVDTRQGAQSWTVTIQFHLPCSGNPWDSSGEHWEDTSIKTQQIWVRPWTPLMHSLENINSSLDCLVPLAWSPTNMPLNTSFPSVSLALDFPFIPPIFPPCTLLP